MSGIFACIGTQPCKDILTNGLSLLKKRGTDTAGMALKTEEVISLMKAKGGTDLLKQNAEAVKSESTVGIAQCSFAVRCKASNITAPPAANNLFAVAIDGSIDNFDALRRWTRTPFPIATEEDLLLAMLCILNTPDRMEMIKKLNNSLHGSPTYVFLPNDEEALYCHAGQQPLLIGIAEDGFLAASELNALLPYAKKYLVLADGENVKITKDRILVYDEKGKRVKKSLFPVPDNSYFENDYSLGDEIYYCPLTVKETYHAFVKNGGLDFELLRISKRGTERVKRILLTGTGSSFYAAKISAFHFEMLTDIPTTAVPSSELRYAGTLMDKNTLLIAVSHRGETDDTIQCVKRAKRLGAKAIAVTSNANSCLARSCDNVLNPHCDFDAGSVSLRSYLSSYLTLCFFALFLGYKNNIVTELYLNVSLKMAEMLPGKISAAIKNIPLLESTALDLMRAEKIFVTGLGADAALAQEAAKKIRDIAKRNAAVLPCGELAEETEDFISGALVLALMTNKELLQPALHPLRRLQSLGARVVILTTSNMEEEIGDFKNIIAFNDSIPLFNPLPCIAGIYKIAVLADEMKNQDAAEQAG